MSVCGQYKDLFNEASHVCFDGHLDDPSFRNVAIQKIDNITDDKISLSKSGDLLIKKQKNKEYVEIAYKDFFGNRIKTKGYPFKDQDSDIIS